MKKLIALLALTSVLCLLAPAQDIIVPKRKFGGSIGPVDFVNDTFTDTDNTLLSSHTGELGAGWTQHPSYATATIAVVSNRADKDVATGTACYFASGTPSSTTYTVEAGQIDIGTATNLSSAACASVDTASNTMVCARRQNSTTMELLKLINGSVTSIDTEPVTWTLNQVRVLKLARNGTNYEWFLDNVSLGSFTIADAELSAAGRVAVRMTGSWADSTAYPILYIRAYQ